MKEKMMNESYQFALEFLNEMKDGTIPKDCMVNHFDNFTGGMEELHRERFNIYLSSCGCYLMNVRLSESMEDYHG